MTLVCRNCSRINPPDARYCYWDGAVLDGRGHARGPIAVGAQPFHSPFVFPSGRQCRNFDELLLGCYSEWKEARELLREGYLESFFGALGRTDLALTAKQAMRAADADADSGLDQLLNKLPCGNREPPKLFVQPLEVNLGQLSRNSDRYFVLHIENHGMGLLQGTIACDDASSWLMLGEGSGSPRKVFQCLHEYTLHVRVHGKALRAGIKPLEGRLTVESNGGATVIVVRAEVPVQPFPEGVLAGVISPRQVAEKAKANPKTAAPYFENGAVAAWYESNGWTYPVQGPASSGLGAIQQFFEALGLVKAPVVEISETMVHLHGAPSDVLEHVLHVRAQEKRPVFAHAATGATGAAWLQIGRISLDGRTAHIPIRVPRVPAQPGEQLHARVQVTANGGQRFLVDVALTIAGRSGSLNAVAADVPVLSAADVVSVKETLPEVATVTQHDRPEIVDVVPFADSDERAGGFRKHLLPLGILVLLLFSVFMHDLSVIFFSRTVGNGAGNLALTDPNPYLFVLFHDKGDDELPLPSMRFGLVANDPEHAGRPKKLTFDEHGRSNNTVLLVDGRQFLFGEPNPPELGFEERDPPGEWLEMKAKLQGEIEDRPRDGLASSWWLPGRKLKITQEVEIVPGAQSRRLDTCLVRYILANEDPRPHRVGLRFMLDTFIGANDGVPFTIPGASGLCDTKMAFNTPNQVPDFIQALEKDDLRDPGTVAYLQFHIGKNIESPSRVLLGGWPNPNVRSARAAGAHAQLTGWNVPFISIKERTRVVDRETGEAKIITSDDSAVTMYWNEQLLPPGRSRVVGFTYGLGNVDTRESGGHLLLTVGGRLVPNVEFTLTALVHNPQPGETLTLDLPAGLQAEGQQRTQIVPPPPAGARRADSPITWRLRAAKDGGYELSVRSSTGTTQKLLITIRTRGVFD